MDLDFTTSQYRQLLQALLSNGYQPVLRFGAMPDSTEVLLRHDVDKRPDCSLRLARIEAEMGVRSIYYFRTVPESLDEGALRQISRLGHEIGYHYESLTTCNGNVDAAYQDFCQNLNRLSNIVSSPIATICMHGSPRSPYDSKDIWQHYDYRPLGIDFEPYFDTDFSQTLYITDTGRRWDGYRVSVRDKIPQYQDKWNAEGLVFHTTSQVIDSLQEISGKYPRLMVTTHPQRWLPFGVGWCKELGLQNIKNIIKGVKVSLSSSK